MEVKCPHADEVDAKIFHIFVGYKDDTLVLCLMCLEAATRKMEEFTGVYKSSMSEKDLTDDSESKEKRRVWLTWADSVAGNRTLRAVSLSRTHARYAQVVTSEEKNTIKSWVEETLTNHLIISGGG